MAEMDYLRKYFENDKLAKHLGISIVDVSVGYAVVTMHVAEWHKNSVGMVHGGTLFSLADFAFAVASNSHGILSVGLNTNMSFLKAVHDGVLTATAREISSTKRTGVYSIDVTTEDGSLVAVMQGTVYRKGIPIAGGPHAEGAKTTT